MTIQLDIPGPGPVDHAARGRELRIMLSDPRMARRVALIVENVRGEPVEFDGELSVQVHDVDARAAVDVLAELSWAGALPESFALL